MKTYRLCVVGCGWMASRGHGPALKKLAELGKNVRLAACCDLDRNRAEQFQKEFGFERAYADLEQMLDRENPDAVYVLTTEAAIFPLSMKILRRGIPLFVEKPPGLNTAEARGLMEMAKREGVETFVAFNRRHMPVIAELLRQLERLSLMDRLQHVSYDFCRVGRTDADFSATAIHGIDLVRYVVKSDYKRIRFHYQELQYGTEKAANIFMDCWFESGVTARLSYCPISGIVSERMAVHATDHSFHVHMPFWTSLDSPGKMIHYAANELCYESEAGKHDEMFIANGFYAEHESFFKQLTGGERSSHSIEDGLQSVEIMECIRNRVPEYNRPH